MQDYARSDREPMQTFIEDDEIYLLELLATIWRGKWIILFCAMVAVLICAYYEFGIAFPKYTATTRLALQVRGNQS